MSFLCIFLQYIAVINLLKVWLILLDGKGVEWADEVIILLKVWLIPVFAYIMHI